MAQWYPLDAGVCLNGERASVYAFNDPYTTGSSADWVIEVGGAPGLDWCIDEAHCKTFGTPSKPGTTCDTNQTLCPHNTTFLGFGGPFSTNCTDNPDFCGFNLARLAPSCTFDMFLGNSLYRNASTFNYSLHFDGMSVLENSIKKLGALGLSKAKQVLFTGVAWGGTAVFLNADRVEGLIRQLNPGLQKFKALPVDGLHPKQTSVIYAGNDLTGPTPDTWLTGALAEMATMAKIDGSSVAVSAGCKKANPGAAWRCLYVNESLPYIKASLFAVNQMLSVWDSQCQIEGIPVPSILQVACSLKGPGWATARQCNQYPEYCDSAYIGNVTAPKQQQYIDDYARSGAQAKPGNGGFFHSCCESLSLLLFSAVGANPGRQGAQIPPSAVSPRSRSDLALNFASDLGSYFQSGWEGTAIWNTIEVRSPPVQHTNTPTHSHTRTHADRRTDHAPSDQQLVARDNCCGCISIVAVTPPWQHRQW